MVITYLIINTLVSISNVTVNSVLIHALIKLKKLNSLSFKFILYLSISDVLLGIQHSIFAAMTLVITDENRFKVFKLCEQFLVLANAMFSINMIVIITVDRFIHMKYLTKYRSLITGLWARMMIAMNLSACLAFATIFTLASVFDFFFTCLLIWTVSAYTLLFIVLGLYLLTYRSIRIQTEQVNLRMNKRTGRRSPDQEFARSMLFILGALVFCYVPVSITVNVHKNLHSKGADSHRSILAAVSFSYLLNYFNSSLNAIIFITFNTQIRQYVSRMSGFRYKQRNCSSNTTVARSEGGGLELPNLDKTVDDKSSEARIRQDVEQQKATEIQA